MLLKEKLKLIRTHLNLTQDQMAEKLGLTSDSRRSRISEWESGRGEPNRQVLVMYTEVACVDVKQLIDDKECLVI
jgi:transcriptional regulator with XRE-family HTH domain